MIHYRMIIIIVNLRFFFEFLNKVLVFYGLTHTVITREAVSALMKLNFATPSGSIFCGYTVTQCAIIITYRYRKCLTAQNVRKSFQNILIRNSLKKRKFRPQSSAKFIQADVLGHILGMKIKAPGHEVQFSMP